MGTLRILAAVAAGVVTAQAPAEPTAAPTSSSAAARFGAMEGVLDISLSPDGKRVVFIGPGAGADTIVFVAPIVNGSAVPIQRATGNPLRLTSCGWSANDRIACAEYGIDEVQAERLAYVRTVAFDADGRNPKLLSSKTGTGAQLRLSQVDARIVDWLDGSGSVLMERDNVPEQTIGTHLAQTANGMSLDKVDTRTLRSSHVETPSPTIDGYITDGEGHARIMRHEVVSATGMMSGDTEYQYRIAGDRAWKPFSRNDIDDHGLRPIAVDGTADVAYALQKKDGRNALYRVALDGSLKTELVYANPDVDVEDVVTIGRRGRVIGATYVTDQREAVYFDPEFSALAKNLSRAIPKLPLIRFVSASADENILLLFAGSDVDPGRYYAYDRQARRLSELLLVRPQLENATLANVKAVTYRAADGTVVPAYLTLPPGGTGKHLPAIVMPHGGPASRDEWGFDWLPQFYAAQGYAVLQPNFRGSTGYGDSWYAKNGFRNWRAAIGDVADGGRWLVSEGIADPAKLAIVGWSYGGYAALQANVIAPDLFKAVIAIAPVTDFAMAKQESNRFTNARLVAAEIGGGANAADGSPARHADLFKAPVLMFHGTIDMNVDIAESRAMEAALRRAGKPATLVVYAGLDHQLATSEARTDMLTRSDAFLRATLKLP